MQLSSMLSKCVDLMLMPSAAAFASSERPRLKSCICFIAESDSLNYLLSGSFPLLSMTFERYVMFEMQASISILSSFVSLLLLLSFKSLEASFFKLRL